MSSDLRSAQPQKRHEQEVVELSSVQLVHVHVQVENFFLHFQVNIIGTIIAQREKIKRKDIGNGI